MREDYDRRIHDDQNASPPYRECASTCTLESSIQAGYSRMQQQASMFRSKGYSAVLTVEKGEGHVMRSLTGERSARLFKEIEESCRGCGARQK